MPIELLKKYNMVTLEEYKDIFGDTEEIEYRFYDTFLKQTDHIPLKIVERLVEDLATATLTSIIGVLVDFIKSIKEEYHEELKYRKFARERIREYENTKTR